MEAELWIEVLDPGGQPLPGATGSVTSTALRGVRRAVGDARGVIRLIDLPPGDYDLTVTLDGFRHAQEDEIPIRRDEPRRIQITLEPAEG